jgi:hypothetical protein
MIAVTSLAFELPGPGADCQPAAAVDAIEQRSTAVSSWKREPAVLDPEGGSLDVPGPLQVSATDEPDWRADLTVSDVPRFRLAEAQVEGGYASRAKAETESMSHDEPAGAIQVPRRQGKALVVDQSAQVVLVYDDGTVIRELPASTGVPPLYTPAFHGRVGHLVNRIYGYGSWADNAWYVFKAGGNIYIHGLPYETSENTKVYRGRRLLGVRPSSHGCIRLSPEDAEWLTGWDPEGVPILISPPDLEGEW